MKDDEILKQLEDKARNLSVLIEYDDLKKGVVNTPGGAFLLGGKKHILVHKHLSLKEKIELLTEILSNMEKEA